MPKKLQLSIPAPCDENWDNMTPVQQGKFCSSCRKQVIDFSNMSDRQVAKFFKKPILSLSKGGSVCGRFMTDQFDRNIEIPKKRIPWFKYFFQFALPAFLVSIKASAEKTQGQIRMKTVTTDTTKRPLEVKLGKVAKPTCIKPLIGDIAIMPVKQDADPRITVRGYVIAKIDTAGTEIITGKVVDEKGYPLPGVSVIIKGTRTGLMADKNGAFYLRAKKGDVLQVLGVDLELTEAKIKDDRNIIISVRTYILGGVSITKSKIKKELKNVPEIPVIIDDKHTVSFKIFPNPVSPGGNLSIEWKQTEEGYYSLQLLNQSGQSVYQKEIWIDAEARVLNIDIPVVTAGSYFILLTNRKSGKRFTEKIIIQ